MILLAILMALVLLFIKWNIIAGLIYLVTVVILGMSFGYEELFLVAMATDIIVNFFRKDKPIKVKMEK